MQPLLGSDRAALASAVQDETVFVWFWIRGGRKVLDELVRPNISRTVNRTVPTDFQVSFTVYRSSFPSFLLHVES